MILILLLLVLCFFMIRQGLRSFVKKNPMHRLTFVLVILKLVRKGFAKMFRREKRYTATEYLVLDLKYSTEKARAEFWMKQYFELLTKKSILP